ncbi:MAG: TldD/PmbA family protein [Solobacterium sp.]|nr:TldD/PmbA family protein [Solobacterium sp.]
MKASFSEYLASVKGGLQYLLDRLLEEYDYVSILSTDAHGIRITASERVCSVSSDTLTSERGTVIRVFRDHLCSEYAFDAFDPAHPEEMLDEIRNALAAQMSVLAGMAVYETGVPDDEPDTMLFEAECGIMPEDADTGRIIADLKEQAVRISQQEEVIECRLQAESNHISKLFLSRNRDLSQSYVYSELKCLVVTAKGEQNRMAYAGRSSRGGCELFAECGDLADEVAAAAVELLSAERIEPGEYTIITSPEVSGLIAHEAFGHGVEMDMFVKKRALGADYINCRVGSDLVTMHEGALAAMSPASYAFDDEGTPAQDVIEIENGILRTGIADALSAKRLGVRPTGNGKRQNFEHKVYTRMTNTVFDPGKDTLEDMVASVDYGFYLEGMESGMEDPKHWGIQCIVRSAREIRDGKFTGRLFAPVILTGYVPDLLGNISMVSADQQVFGTGFCGKGYKEWVKVADGGPCLKTVGRLG